MTKVKKTTKIITKETSPSKKNKITSNSKETKGKSNSTSLLLPILCITVPIALFAIISLLVLKIDYNINELLHSIFNSIADEEVPYDKLKYLRTIMDLNASAFSNNMTFLVYNLLSTLLLSAGGFILYRTLEYKQEIKGLIKANKNIKNNLRNIKSDLKEALEEMHQAKEFINKNNFYNSLSMHLYMTEDAIGTLVFSNYTDKRKMSKAEYETATKYTSGARDSIAKLHNMIGALSCKSPEDFPFYNENQANLVILKMKRIHSRIQNTIFRENMEESLERLLSSISNIEKWKVIFSSNKSVTKNS